MPLNINESIIPLNFNWRAGIGTEQNIQPEDLLLKPKTDPETGRPVYDFEYFDSVWNELIAELTEQTNQFLFERMCSMTYSKINQIIIFTIDKFISQYPIILGFGFQNYMREIKPMLYSNLELELYSTYPEKGFAALKRPSECEFIYVDDMILSKIYLDHSYLINYLLNYKK